MKKHSFRFKISAIFFTLVAFIMGVLFASLYYQAVKTQTQKIREDLSQTAALGASLLDADEIRGLPLNDSTHGRPYFSMLLKKLRSIKDSDPNIDDVYVLVPIEKKPVYRWLANANHEEGAVICGENYDASKIPALLAARYAPSVDEHVIQDKWGFWISGYAPVMDSKKNTVAVVGVDMAANVFDSLRNNFLGNYVLALFLALIFAVLAGSVSSGYLSKPVDLIVKGMEKVGRGDLDHKLSVRTGDEFEKISNIFNQMTKSLKDNIEKLTIATREKERINRELEIAAGLQKRALPRHTPQIPGIEIAAESIAALEVGGDYFDFLTSKKTEIGFVIADAAGKGLPGTIFMTNSRSIFRVVSHEDSNPSRALKKANDYICGDAQDSGGFITLFYGVYDISSKKFTFANAGHNPQLLFRKEFNHGFRLLEAGGAPMGVIEGETFLEHTIQLNSEDMLLMYTDGVVEAMDSGGQMFGLPRLIEILRPYVDKEADVILSAVKSALKDFVGDQAQFDDITMIVLKVK